VSEPPFRSIAIGLVLAALAISTFYRAKAERFASPLSERPPDRGPVVVMRVLGIAFWGLILTDPPWLGWSKIGIPEPLRWIGAGLGVAILFSTALTFRSLGRNITSSVVTRREHTLTTTGPYRWVRHPLYAAGLLLHLALALLLSSWLVALAGLATLGFILPRIRREEAHLAARFGGAYEEYRRRSGSLFPRLRR
jgi:protein-S-isoprenylcysteine O-methyltransferase Ste14